MLSAHYIEPCQLTLPGNSRLAGHSWGTTVKEDRFFGRQSLEQVGCQLNSRRALDVMPFEAKIQHHPSPVRNDQVGIEE